MERKLLSNPHVGHLLVPTCTVSRTSIGNALQDTTASFILAPSSVRAVARQSPAGFSVCLDACGSSRWGCTAAPGSDQGFVAVGSAAKGLVMISTFSGRFGGSSPAPMQRYKSRSHCMFQHNDKVVCLYCTTIGWRLRLATSAFDVCLHHISHIESLTFLT